jgi:very-short-patch-repair endonuclease
MRREYDEAILRLAAAQHGIVARWQLTDQGIAAAIIDRRIRRGDLEHVAPCTYCVTPLATSHARAATAVFSFGRNAVASHWTAGELQQLVNSVCDPGARVASVAAALHVSVSSGHPRTRAGVVLHRVRLQPDERVVCDGIPATSPARTLLDLAPELSDRQLEQALAAALRAEITSEEAMLAMAQRYPRRPGASRLRMLLVDEATPAFTRSEAEQRFLQIVRRARMPQPGVNARLNGFEVDFHWRDQRVVEIDGLAYHSSRSAQRRDRQRDTALAAAGYRVLRFTWDDVTRQIEAVVAQVSAALARGHIR